MPAILSDLRRAFRKFRQQPGFVGVAVITLALGLGANTAVFTLIHAVMLRPLPVTRPSELYRGWAAPITAASTADLTRAVTSMGSST